MLSFYDLSKFNVNSLHGYTRSKATRTISPWTSRQKTTPDLPVSFSSLNTHVVLPSVQIFIQRYLFYVYKARRSGLGAQKEKAEKNCLLVLGARNIYIITYVCFFSRKAFLDRDRAGMLWMGEWRTGFMKHLQRKREAPRMQLEFKFFLLLTF